MARQGVGLVQGQGVPDPGRTNFLPGVDRRRPTRRRLRRTTDHPGSTPKTFSAKTFSGQLNSCVNFEVELPDFSSGRRRFWSPRAIRYGDYRFTSPLLSVVLARNLHQTSPLVMPDRGWGSTTHHQVLPQSFMFSCFMFSWQSAI
jgi:hypothetical protein